MYQPLKPKRGATVSEVAAGGRVTVEDLVREKPTASSMRRLWDACHRRAYPGVPVGGWTGKDTGMMKNFARVCAGSGIDPMAAIVEAVTGWNAFCERVRRDNGRKGPDLPAVWLVAISARVFATSGAAKAGSTTGPAGEYTTPGPDASAPKYSPPGSKDY